MKWIVLLSVLWISSACEKKLHCINSGLPECIEEILANDSIAAPLKTIQVQTLNGEHHYWLNTEATSTDGVEFIINNKCDTVCAFCGECEPPACTWDYKSEWKVIWRG